MSCYENFASFYPSAAQPFTDNHNGSSARNKLEGSSTIQRTFNFQYGTASCLLHASHELLKQFDINQKVQD